jgi:hypothetical protein
LLTELGLSERRRETVGSFSRGLQQKVAVSAALITDPPIILLDEPTIGLDVEAARTFKDWIRHLARDEGKTIVLTTHQLEGAQELSNRIAVIKDGEIIADLPTAELLARHAENRFEIRLTGSLNGTCCRPAPASSPTATRPECCCRRTPTTGRSSRSWTGWAPPVPDWCGISLFIGGGQLVKDLMVRTLPALLAVVVAGIAAVEGTGGITEEINGGTLEQTRMSPASPQLQALGRMTALAIEGLGCGNRPGHHFCLRCWFGHQPAPGRLGPSRAQASWLWACLASRSLDQFRHRTLL